MSESSVVRTAVRARPGRSQDVSRHRHHRSARWFCDRIQNLKRWQFGQESKQCGPRSSLVMVIQHLLFTLAQASACGYAMTKSQWASFLTCRGHHTISILRNHDYTDRKRGSLKSRARRVVVAQVVERTDRTLMLLTNQAFTIRMFAVTVGNAASVRGGVPCSARSSRGGHKQSVCTFPSHLSLSLSLSVVIGSSPGCYGAYPALLSRQSRRGGRKRERSDGLETAGAAKSDLASAIALA